MKLAAPTTLQTLTSLLPGATLTAWENHDIYEIYDDSREVKNDALFVAVDAPSDLGWRYVADAQRRGALAILLEVAARERYPQLAAACITVPNARQALAQLAAWATRYPARELQLCGITGTNGKTTTTHFLDAIFRLAGVRSGRIGTLGAQYLGVDERVYYTTPPPLVLQPLLRRMVQRGVTAVTMEVSSHALALERVAGLQFTAAAFTNISRDHLDFHTTFEAYIAAKRVLLTQCDHAVINIDDAVGEALFAEFGGTAYTLDGTRAAEYRAQGAQVLMADAIITAAEHSEFDVDGTHFVLPLQGRFNIANALAAIGLARRVGLSDAACAQGLAAIGSVPGRMEQFHYGAYTAVVDYAHTPDALERVLAAAREAEPTRVTVVFGCGGGRDSGKRPLMGEVAERLADRCILTADNPRHEDPAAIIAQIRAGMQNDPIVIADRAAAIEFAISEAIDGECIVIAGKGAETEQIIGANRLPFDDRAIVRAALERRM